MAPAKSQAGDAVKRRRKRKARTQVSSSSDSSDTSSSSDSESEAEVGKEVKQVKQETNREDKPRQSPAESRPEPSLSFSAWYLRQVAKELEDDLDKVRSAGDFSESSLPVLINALKQGASTFTAEEKMRIAAVA